MLENMKHKKVKNTYLHGKRVNVCFYRNLSDHPKCFTLHSLEEMFTPTPLDFNEKHSAPLQLLREEYSLTLWSSKRVNRTEYTLQMDMYKY